MAVMAAPPDTAVRLGLVGTGKDLVRAIEALKSVPSVEIVVVSDASDRSDGGKLAKTLQLNLVKNAMEVFRTQANIILEVNGDERQYERLLSIKPPGVEVVSVRGARLLIDLFTRVGGGAPAPPSGSKPAPTKGEGPKRLEPLTGALHAALRKSGTPEDAAKTLLPAVAAAAGMGFAGLAVSSDDGFSWILPSSDGEPLSHIPTDQLRQALTRADPLWLVRPAKGLGTAGLLPLRVGEEVLGLLAVARPQDTPATPDELMALRLGADLLASAFRATQPAPAPTQVVKEVPVEIIREVVKEVVKEVPVEIPVEVPFEVVKEVVREVLVEVPVEVVKEVFRDVPVEVLREVEVVKEVVREVLVEVPVEVVKEVVKEVPVQVEVIRETTQVDEEEMRRLRRRLEELQTAQEQMATRGGRVSVDEKMQALLNMAGGVGHVFNNVLAGILGRTQLLLKRASREKPKDLLAGLSEIETATRTGIDALTRIQEFSRARPSEAFGPVDLNDVVQRAVEQTRPKWRDDPAAKGVRIELITHFGPHSRLIGAESELLDAVVHLISNAVEAMPRGGTLTIRTGLDSGRGVISVADTGVGMADSVRRRAFEPFFSTKGEAGLGLGLSMVYGVMARHGGEASLESEEGRGTTVRLRVPTSGEGAPVHVTIPDADRTQVLLVDDDETLRTAVGDMLRGAGYAVALGASGLEGIAKVREREVPFDLVVTDLGMPDVPGWEVVEHEETSVSFRELTPRELGHHLTYGEWEGRAGGYAIQGRGAALVERIEGDYLNVVGLPGALLMRLLRTAR